MKLLSNQLIKLSLTLLLALTPWGVWTALPTYAQGPTVAVTEFLNDTNGVGVKGQSRYCSQWGSCRDGQPLGRHR